MVIGILAAISIVAYNGISQNAKNTATIAAARQAVNAINLYIAEKGVYPATSGRCLTTSQTCVWGASTIAPDATFQAVLKEYGGLPQLIANTTTSTYGGLYYSYAPGRRYNGVSRPVVVVFPLSGVDQKCQLPNVTNSGGDIMKPSTSGYTSGDQGGATVCVISIDGPPAA